MAWPPDQHPFAARRKEQLQKQAMPFLDDKPMIGPPGFTGKEFHTPRLRRCTFDLDTILFEAQLGAGADGVVWKVWFEDSGPFALKVFWDTVAPGFYSYWAAQRECQNAAVLQMMQASVTSAPVPVFDKPQGRGEAEGNFCSFSQESEQKLLEEKSKPGFEMPGDMWYISSLPRMVQCYGWLKISGSLFEELPRHLRPPNLRIDKVDRSISYDMEYIAIVFELVEDGENVPSVVEEVDNFMYHAGFAHTCSPLARNWKSGVLVDLSDIVHFNGYGWYEDYCGKRKASDILLE